MKTPSFRGQMFLKVLKSAKHGTLELVLPDGSRDQYGEGAPQIHVHLKNWKALDLLFSKGDIGLAEAIVDDLMLVDDVAALVEWACRNDQDLAKVIYGSWYGTIASKIHHFLNRNNRKGAQKNIMAHYDLGNEFYSLWLDESMTYSSAIFKTPNQSLAEAQNQKYDQIIDSLEIKSGDHLLEIGCGWGGFFSRAIERTGCKVTAVANSPEQIRYNQAKIEKQNMKDHVEVLQQDYRDISGRFDKVISIEMIEAVGEQYWNTFFSKMRASLKEKGKAAIQGITIREDLFYSYKKGTDFIQQSVFPGGMLLTDKAVSQASEQNGLMVYGSHEFGLDYARTLKLWRENFNKALPHVRGMGFDDRFIRLWNLYLAYCEGAFRAQRISVSQFWLVPV